MKIADIPELRDAPLAIKLELVEELWADIAAKADEVPLPAWHVQELDRSSAEHATNPDEGSTWPEVRDRILGRRPRS